MSIQNLSSNKPRLLLIQPPIYDFALYDHYLKPYGLLRLGRFFSDGGWRVEFLDCLDYRDLESLGTMPKPARKPDGTGKFFRQVLESPLKEKAVPRRFARYGIHPDVIDRRIREARPDLVFITSGMTYWYRGVMEITERISRLLPGAPAALGGIYASLMPDHARRFFEAGDVFPGEGVVKDAETGDWDLAAPLGEFLNKNSLPVPTGVNRSVRPLLTPGTWDSAGVIRMNSGCPFKCDYCASRKIARGFHPGDPDEAFQAMMDIHRFSGTRNFAFYDDALLFKKKGLFQPFLERVIRENPGFRFYTPNAVHLAYLDRETAELMKKAGFQEIRLGYESASEDFHRLRDGKFDPASFPGKIEVLKESGFSAESIRVYILAGLPGQRAVDVEQSVRFAKKTGVSISLSEYSPVPGSPMWGESCRISDFPLKKEPLYHNNTFFPMEWEGFTRLDLERIKQLIRLKNA